MPRARVPAPAHPPAATPKNPKPDVADAGKSTAATPAPDQPRGWRTSDLAAYGRRLGAEYRAAPANRARIATLAALYHEGLLDGYDPDDRFGVGYRVSCGLTCEPDEPDRRYPYPLDCVPAEVVDFWEDLIIEVRSNVEVMMIANHPAFAAAFVEAVIA